MVLQSLQETSVWKRGPRFHPREEDDSEVHGYVPKDYIHTYAKALFRANNIRYQKRQRALEDVAIVPMADSAWWNKHVPFKTAEAGLALAEGSPGTGLIHVAGPDLAHDAQGTGPEVVQSSTSHADGNHYSERDRRLRALIAPIVVGTLDNLRALFNHELFNTHAKKITDKVVLQEGKYRADIGKAYDELSRRKTLKIERFVESYIDRLVRMASK
jgi:hypothetical protein